MAKIECICKECGINFFVDECYIKRDGKRIYCSMACRIKNISGSKNPRYKADQGWLKCVYCGDMFKVKPSSILAGKNRTYCTKECKEKNKIDCKKTSICAECGSSFTHYAKKEAKFCSRSCASINYYRHNKQTNKGVQRGYGGIREDLDNLYVRSSWEANYARYLNYLLDKKEIRGWEYEPDTFEFLNVKKGTRFYTPDFKIILNNGGVEYHEVKGMQTDRSVKRINLMNEYYPDVNIIIIDKIWFRRNGTKLSKIIRNWEINGSSNKRLY